MEGKGRPLSRQSVLLRAASSGCLTDCCWGGEDRSPAGVLAGHRDILERIVSFLPLPDRRETTRRGRAGRWAGH